MEKWKDISEKKMDEIVKQLITYHGDREFTDRDLCFFKNVILVDWEWSEDETETD